MTSEQTLHSVGHLVVTQQTDNDGVAHLRAQTGGVAVGLDHVDAAMLGSALLGWARARAIEMGCTAGGDCPVHPHTASLHDPAFASGRWSS